MEWDRREAAELVGVEASVEAVAVVVEWEVHVPALDPAENASALIVGHASHIRWVIPAITGVVLNAEQRWREVNGGNIANAAFKTDGCSNAIASCGMATEMCKGKRISEAQKIEQKDILAALEGLTEEGEHCALLAANTLKAAIENYLTRQT